MSAQDDTAGKLRCLSQIALDAADGWTRLNEAARELIAAGSQRIETLEACLRCDDASVRTAWAREARWKAEHAQLLAAAKLALAYGLFTTVDGHDAREALLEAIAAAEPQPTTTDQETP